jgi:uncharacterized protein YukE
MAEKVEIKGGELDGSVLQNAASEATLVRLVELIEKQELKNRSSSAPSGTNQRTQKLQDLYNRSLQTSDKELKNLEKSTKEASGTLKNLAKDLAGLATGLLSRIDKTIGNSLNIAFSSATPKLTQLTDALADTLGPVGNTVRVFGNLLQETVTDFQQLSQSGADLGGSLLNVKRQAVEAGLSVENFKKVVVDNSAGLATLGGTVGQGAARFAKINGALEKQFGPALSRLGISMEEAAENTSSYLILQQRLGRLNQMSTEQVVQGAMQYNLELDKLARATGVQRREIEKNNQVLQTEARFKAALAKMDANQAAAVSAEISKLDKIDSSGRLSKALKDIIGSGGKLLTDESKMLALAMKNAGVDITAIGREIFKGNADAVKEIAPAFSKLAEYGSNLTDAQRGLIAITETQGRLIPDTMAILARGIQTTGENFKSAIDEQNKAINDAGKNMADIDRVLVTAKNSLNTALMPVIEGLNQAGGNLLKLLQPGGSLLNSLESYSRGVADYLANFMQVLSTQGPSEAFSKLWTDLTEYAKPHVVNMINGIEKVIKETLGPAIAAGIASLFASPLVVGALVAGISTLIAFSLAKAAIASNVAKGAPLAGIPSNRVLKGVGVGTVIGVGAELAANTLGRETRAGAAADVLGDTAGMAATGALVGSFIPVIGTAVGAITGGLLGLGTSIFKNSDALFKKQQDQVAAIDQKMVEATGTLNQVSGVGQTNILPAGQVNPAQTITNINAHVRLIERETAEMLSDSVTSNATRTIDVNKEQSAQQNIKLDSLQNVQTQTLNSSTTLLNDLNTKIAELIILQKEANDIAKDIEDAAKRNVTNMANPGRRSAA